MSNSRSRSKKRKSKRRQSKFASLMIVATVITVCILVAVLASDLHRKSRDLAQTETMLERFHHLPVKPRSVVEETAPPPAVKIVHKQAAPDVTEELLEQLEEQRTRSTVHTDSREEVTRRQSHQVDVNQMERKVVAQTTEDITELVNRTLARQMRTISDQVYRQMEKRLQAERSRRGRL